MYTYAGRDHRIDETVEYTPPWPYLPVLFLSAHRLLHQYKRILSNDAASTKQQRQMIPCPRALLSLSAPQLLFPVVRESILHRSVHTHRKVHDID